MSEIKRVLIPRAGEDETLVRRLGHAVLLQWASLPAEAQKLIADQASEVEFLGLREDPAAEAAPAFLRERRSWVEADRPSRRTVL